MKKAIFITLFALFFAAAESASAQITWAWQVNFSDGADNYSGVIALHEMFSGYARFKAAKSGAIIEERLHWAPTQADDSYWLIGENVRMIQGKIDYNPDFILIRMDPKTVVYNMFFNSNVLAGMDEFGKIIFYPAQNNFYFRANNQVFMGPSNCQNQEAKVYFNDLVKNLNWSYAAASAQINNVVPRFYKSN